MVHEDSWRFVQKSSPMLKKIDSAHSGLDIGTSGNQANLK